MSEEKVESKVAHMVSAGPTARETVSRIMALITRSSGSKVVLVTSQRDGRDELRRRLKKHLGSIGIKLVDLPLRPGDFPAVSQALLRAVRALHEEGFERVCIELSTAADQVQLAGWLVASMMGSNVEAFLVPHVSGLEARLRVFAKKHESLLWGPRRDINAHRSLDRVIEDLMRLVGPFRPERRNRHLGLVRLPKLPIPTLGEEEREVLEVIGNSGPDGIAVRTIARTLLVRRRTIEGTTRQIAEQEIDRLGQDFRRHALTLLRHKGYIELTGHKPPRLKTTDAGHAMWRLVLQSAEAIPSVKTAQ